MCVCMWEGGGGYTIIFWLNIVFLTARLNGIVKYFIKRDNESALKKGRNMTCLACSWRSKTKQDLQSRFNYPFAIRSSLGRYVPVFWGVPTAGFYLTQRNESDTDRA